MPSGPYEKAFVIQDRMFDTNGQWFFPDDGINPNIHPFWRPEFFGDTIVVNGKAWPYLEVEPRRYRMRVLNGSNARFYNLAFENGMTFWQIGTDGGLLDKAVPLTQLRLAPGERADIIVDFKELAIGSRLLLTNSANAPFPNGDPVDPDTTGQIMQLRVIALQGTDHSVNPATSPSLRPWDPIQRLEKGIDAQTPVRHLTLNEHMGPNGPAMIVLNNLMWSAPIQEKPRVGATEIWEIINLTMDTHPIHLHLVQFQLLSRQNLNAMDYMTAYDAAFPGGQMIPDYGPPRPNDPSFPGGNPDVTPFLVGPQTGPDANEYGWKDTVQMNPGQVTRIAVRWAPQKSPVTGHRAPKPGDNRFPFTPYLPFKSADPLTGYKTGPGYVWHCHILDHEDNEMMRPYVIAP